MSRPRLVALLLALATLAVYLPVAGHDFLSYDDDFYVTENPMVTPGLTLAGLKWAFTTFYACNWHPLTWLSHMTDCQFFGLNAGAHHLVNVLFHAANSVLLFALLFRLTGLMKPALFTAALFAWHPLHVESVAWVAERKDVLSTFFGLLALLSYVKYARENRRGSYWLALGFAVLGLLAKPMLVTLPFLLLLLDFWPLQRWSLNSIRWPLIREKIPFFAVAAASCVMTYLAQSRGQAVASTALVPVYYRVENAMVSVCRYLLKMAWPVDLAVLYPFGAIAHGRLALAVAALAGISLAVWLGRNQRYWLVGWLWFLGTLVPVIGLVQVGGASMADRYSYIPSIGIFTAVAFGLHAWTWSRKYYSFIVALPLLACVLLTERQLSFWRNGETLFRHAIAVTKDNDYAHLNLAIALDGQDRPTEALAEYREALRLNPAAIQCHLGMGNMLLKLGRPAEALPEYRACLAAHPDDPVYHNAAADALMAEGDVTGGQHEYAEAERLDPYYAAPHLGLAKNDFQNGRDTQGNEELRAAVRAAPDDYTTLVIVAHYLAANTNDAARDAAGAVALALKANDLSGNRQPEVFDVLGMALAAEGDFSNALISANNALEFTPAAKLKDAGPIRERLELYQKQMPWRESFRSTNAPNTP